VHGTYEEQKQMKSTNKKVPLEWHLRGTKADEKYIEKRDGGVKNDAAGWLNRDP
jgi:hypothetical protein